MKDNPVAKNAHKFNKRAAGPHKDKKKALKKGDVKHKGRYEDSGDIEERSTLDVISSVLKRNKDRGKYQAALKAVKSGKYKIPKAAQVYDVSPRVLQDLVAEGKMNEKNKGLWHNIHQKRKRGEKPAKPGEKGYPKTLDIESKNTPGDGNPCWDTHKKVGTKMKNGKRVNDCVPKNEGLFDKKKDSKKKENPRRKSDAVNSLLNRPKQMRGRKEQMESAQDRLDRMAKKHGLGKPNKAADDYMAKMRKKYGAKDDADLKRKMGMKESHEVTGKTFDEIRGRK